MLTAADVVQGWKQILAGRKPFLSIEITKECPLSCPGCYAYTEEHLNTGGLLRELSDFKGDQLVRAVLDLVDQHRPLHLSIVGGEPLVRFRELNKILPQIAERKIHIQLVTSAVRPIPLEWHDLPNMTLVVSIDGLQPEHDERRKPATYERVLTNIAGHRITVHCTITRQMCGRPGYLGNFLEFWSARSEVEKIWFSIFTPQIGEHNEETLLKPEREHLIREMLVLRNQYPKLYLPKGMIEVYAAPPRDPKHCTFSRTTRNISADLKTAVTPCQFGGNPDCSKCGCVASAGLEAIARHRLPGHIKVGWIFDGSLKIGEAVRAIRRKPNTQ